MKKYYNELLAFLRSYFGFTNREAKGYLVLMIFLFVLMIIPSLYDVPTTYNDEQRKKDQAMLDSLVIAYEKMQKDKKYEISEKSFNQKEYQKKEHNIEYQYFNPNNADSLTFLKIGVPFWLTSRIIKFRNKGGRFKEKTDLQKIYGFPTDLYAKLEPYIILDSQQTKQDIGEKILSEKPIKKQNELPKFDLNTATTTDLEKIRGIGSATAQKIINFREKLGGFATWEIVQMTYGIKPEQIDSLKKYAYLDINSVKKIPLNTISADSLAKFPLISKRQAQAIVNYRSQHGNYQKPEDLLKTKVLPDSLVNFLAPYWLLE